MNEKQWQAGTNPSPMLVHILDKASPRKLRLFVCACARQLWERFRDPRSRHAIEVAERFADGQASEVERQAAWTTALEAQVAASWDATLEAIGAACPTYEDLTDASLRVIEVVVRVQARRAAMEVARQGRWRAVRQMRESAELVARSHQCDLLRDVFGNPWRPLTVEPTWLAWGATTVPHIAHVLYQERRFAELPVLADALEEAGCTDEAILDHCRGGGEHARGCHVLDLLLGKK
jgi:hypothetical protein